MVLTVIGLNYVSDLAPAAWIPGRLHPFGLDVGSVVPEGLEDCARLLHPAHRDGESVSWRQIAAASGRTIHPEVQFGNIAGSWHASRDPRLWTRPPLPGTLTPEMARALVGILRPHTRTSELCWFGVWTGLGQLRPIEDLPQFVTEQRAYYLASGPLDDAVHGVYGEAFGYQSANMWWPDDRSWFVATEVDLAYTYVAGTRECIRAVIADPDIEAVSARLTDKIAWDSDGINPSPGPPP